MKLTTLNDNLSDCGCKNRSGASANKAGGVADVFPPLSNPLGKPGCCGKKPTNQNINHIVIGQDAAAAANIAGRRAVGRGYNGGIALPPQQQPQTGAAGPKPLIMRIPVIKKVVQRVKTPVYRNVQRPYRATEEQPVYRNVQRPYAQRTVKRVIVTPDRIGQVRPVRTQPAKGKASQTQYRGFY